MAVKKSQCREINVDKGTPGGDTYTVVRNNGKNVEEKLCFRPLPNKFPLRCSRSAGRGTWHTGSGACARHGGKAGRPVTHARNADQAKTRFAGVMAQYLSNRTRLLDLSEELAVSKAMYWELIEHFPEVTDDTYGRELTRLNNLLTTIGNTVERISRVESRNSLTAAQVMYMRAVIADVFVRWIDDPVIRENAVKDLVARLGVGSDHDPLLPTENVGNMEVIDMTGVEIE